MGEGSSMDGAASTQASAEEHSGVSIAPAIREPEEEAYVDSLVRASLQLLRKDLPLEVRCHGFKMMRHLLRFRWDELRITEWSVYGDAADVIVSLAARLDQLPLRSATAALVAQGIWSGGISFVNDLLPSLTCLSKAGPIEAELVAFILKWISDFRIVCTVDLEGGQCETGLYGLDEVLPNIMLILSSLLKKHDEAIFAEQPDQLMVSTENHVLVVKAGLLAANAYAEWVPVVHLGKYGLIERCKSLLHLSKFRIHALQFFKILCQRRRPLSVAKDYDATMSHVFRVLMSISEDCLTESRACSNSVSESQLDFTEHVCDCLVALGLFHMQCIIADDISTSHFLQQMLDYYQHYKIALHFRCLPFWLMVLTERPKDNFVDPSDVASAVNPASMDTFSVSDDICSVILDVSFKRMLKTSTTTSPKLLELWSDELHGKNGFIQYHSTLLDLIGFITYRRPILAASRVAQRISSVIGDANTSTSPKDLAALESAQLELKTVVNAIFDDSVKNAEISLDNCFPLHRIYSIFGGLLLQLLSLKWMEPRLAVILGQYLNALCPYLRHRPNAVAVVMNKLFELLSSITVNSHDPSTAQNACLQICSCVIHICQAVDRTALPSDMKDFFSLPHITAEDVLAFGVLNRSTYSVEQNKGLALLISDHELRSPYIFPISGDTVWKSCLPGEAASSRMPQGEGENQDRDTIHPTASNTRQVSDQTSGLQPWVLKGERTGLSVALSYQQDPPSRQPCPDSCSDPSYRKANLFTSLFGWFGNRSAHKHQFYVNDSTLNPRKLGHSLLLDTQLYSSSFPLHGSVPISWLGLGTESQNSNGGKSLSLSLESQISARIYKSSSLAYTCSPGIVHSCFSLATQRQQLHMDGELLTCVTSVTQAVDYTDKLGDEGPPIYKCVGGGGQGSDQEYNTVQDNVTSDVEGPTESFEQKMRGMDEATPYYQGKSEILVGEHNLLSEAFSIVATFPGIQYKKQLLMSLLNPLNKIWTQPEWEDRYLSRPYKLLGLLSNEKFLRTFFRLVKSFEGEFSRHIIGDTFPQLMLALLVRMLRHIQIVWTEPCAYDLAAVTGKAKLMSSEEIFSFLVETNKFSDTDEKVRKVETIGAWLWGIQETGYNVIGLAASVDRALFGLDSCVTINDFVNDIMSLDFDHLGKLIQLAIIPLVKYCPQECWDEWMVELLQPLFFYCEEILYDGWFTLIHEGRAKVPFYYFGDLYGPEENVKELELDRLRKFNLSISDLLEVLSSEGLNSGLPYLNHGPHDNRNAQDLKSISSSSLIGYLLLHDCFGRLSMYLFGSLVDYQAAQKAIPFCHALIRLAVATDDERLNLFILNEMLPTVVRLLGGAPQSAISRLCLTLNPSIKVDTMEDIVCLCREIYEVYKHNQVMVGETVDRTTIASGFNDWLAEELACLHKRASCPAPTNFSEHREWNWEFNEEFERYLPTYMDMLHEVDAMDDCLEPKYWERDDLLEKLKPEFKSRHAINSIWHPYLRTMFHMLQRKMPGIISRRCSERSYKFLIQLITLKPFIKLTDCWESSMDRLDENCDTQFDPLQCDASRALNIFQNSMLFYWEPQFHPLLREGHKELLTTIARQLTLAEESELFEPLEPSCADFLDHLLPYATVYFMRKEEESGPFIQYFRAKEQVGLHEEFDNHLATGALDHVVDEFSSSKDDFVQKVVGRDIDKSQFGKLDHDLIKMSFERRVKFVQWQFQIDSYSRYLRALLDNEKMKNKLVSLVSGLEAEGFFRIDDDSIDWEKKQFTVLLDKFNELTGHRLDKCYAIRVIMVLQTVLQRKDATTWHDVFRMVQYANDAWKENLQQLWMRTRYYEHDYYDILRQPLKKVFESGRTTSSMVG